MRVDNVNQTHLVLASGKLVSPKKFDLDDLATIISLTLHDTIIPVGSVARLTRLHQLDFGLKILDLKKFEPIKT